MTADHVSRPWWRDRQTLLLLAACAVFIAVVRIYVLPPDPLNRDSSIYAAIARELLAGKGLYTQVWDHKPPALYWTWAAVQAVTGHEPPHDATATGILFAILTLVAVYAAASFGGRHRFTGAIAAVLWTIVSAVPTISAQQPNTEVFVNATQTAAFALLVYGATRKMDERWAAVTGVVLGLASMYKTIVVVFAITGALAYLAGASRETSVQRIKNVGVMAAASAAPWVLVFMYFSANGSLAAAWDAIITFNRAYAGNLWANLSTLFDPAVLMPDRLYPLYPLFLAVAGGAMLANWRKPSARTLLGLALGLAVWIEIALPGRYYPHYYQLWLPALCIGSAWSIEATGARFGALAFRVGGLAIIGACLALNLPLYRTPPEEWSARIHQGIKVYNRFAVAPLINDLLEPDERFLVFGAHGELYYYSGRRPPVPELRFRQIFNGSRTGPRLKAVLDSLTRSPPEMVVSTGGWSLDANREPYSRWILERYARFMPRTGEHHPRITRFYYRKGGALERRLGLAGSE